MMKFIDIKQQIFLSRLMEFKLFQSFGFVTDRIADDHVIQNEKDADEYLRGFSPSFDVLVNDEMRDYDYYHDEDQF
jgi:hypothetical protein